MPYGNPGGRDIGAPAEMHDPGMHQEGQEEGSWHLPSDLLPKGMKLKKGDIVELVALADSDADGDTAVGYNYGKDGESEGKSDGSKEESWEDEFRRDMSPRKEEDSMSGGGY